ERQVVVAGPEPECRQQQDLPRQLLLHSLCDGGYENGVGERRQVPAVLLASRDRRDDHGPVARHLPQLRGSHFVEFHGSYLWATSAFFESKFLIPLISIILSCFSGLISQQS